MVQIPVPQNLPFLTLQCQLDGVTYTLQLRWNVRVQGWWLDVFDEQGTTVLLAGLRLVLGAAIGANVTGRPFPGFFFLIDTTANNVDPGLNDLGNRILLEYVEGADVAAIGGL
jgi:hypothetical protein